MLNKADTPDRATVGGKDRVAAQLGGVGPLGIVVTVAILLAGNVLGAALTIAWALAARVPLARLGLRPPQKPVRIVVGGVVGGIALKLLMKALVMPMLGFGPINPAYQYLVGNRAALPGTLLAVVFGAGVGEEIVWRGFLFTRLDQLIPCIRGKHYFVLLISSVLFGVAHYHDQGAAGMAQAFVTGLVFGGLFLVTGHLWLSMVVHAAFDVTAVLIIFWNLESWIGRWGS
jgi:membrane protease YdiL (CAAX protease family)